MAKASNKTEDFVELENLIKSYISRIDQLKEELKEKKDMLEDALAGDAVYQEHAEKAKEANKIKSATRQQILQQPALKELSERLKEIKFDIKEQEVILNDYLQQYQKATGATQIEQDNGEIVELITVIRLVRRKKAE